MSYCINKNNPKYKLNLANLTRILGNSNAAIAALELNNGYSLDLAPNGQPSELYNLYLNNVNEQFPTLSTQEKIKKAFLLKLRTLLNSTNFDESESESSFDKNGEPTIHADFLYRIKELDKDTQDILSLLRYQGLKQGIDEVRILENISNYLAEDPYAVSYAKDLLDKVTIRQAQLHTMGYDFNKEQYFPDGTFDWETYLGGIDLNHDLTENDLYINGILRFSPIYDYQVDPAEIIMPKLYRSNYKIGGYSLSEIDENFFKKVNPFYQSDLKEIKGKKINDKGKIDFLVRCHNYKFNIVVVDSFSDFNIEGLKPIKISTRDGYRVSKSGEQMYKLPEDNTLYQIYTDNKGNETIVFHRSEHELSIKNLLNSLSRLDLVSIQPFFENIDVTEKWLDYIINLNNIDTYDRNLELLKYSLKDKTQDEIRQELVDIYLNSKNRYENDLSNILYNSFIKTLYAISVRIPTQAFQSIMAVKVAGLTDDKSNNIFVSRWQFWLQGSDLDIDKSYIMGADVSRFGKYNHWSPIANYTTRKLTEISDKLPIPNQTYIVSPENYYLAADNLQPIIFREAKSESDQINQNLKDLLDDFELSYSSEEQAITQLAEKYKLNYNLPKLKETIRLSIIEKGLRLIKPGTDFILPESYLNRGSTKKFIQKINKHNSHIVTAEEARNIVQSNIIKVSLDERNMMAGYSPIDQAMEYFKNALKKIEDKSALERDLDDGGLSIARTQYVNSVGKKDVGIMANGLKAFFALTQYFNKYRKDIANLIDSNRYFLTKLNINGKSNYFSTISDIQFEQEAIRILNNALHIYCPEAVNNQLTFANKDASLLISSLISLATDNAKELALAKMNASVNLASMHLFLVVMGYDAESVVKFTTSPEFSYLAKKLDNSKFSNSGLSVTTLCNSIISGEDTDFVGDKDEYANILYVYSCAQEMSKIAQIGSINQGTKVDELDADSFFTKLQNIITDQLALVHKLDDDTEVSMNNYQIQISTGGLSTLASVPNVVFALRQFESPELEKIFLQKLNELNQRNQQNRYMESDFTIDMNRYFNDEKYRQFCTDLYNLFKFNFNVLDCMNNLPHFYEMLHAFVVSETIIKQSSSRARTLLNEAYKSYIQNRLYTRKEVVRENSYGTSTAQVKAYNVKGFDDSVQRSAGKFYDDYILSEYLSENALDFTISYLDSNGNEKVIIPNTNEGLIEFANFVAYTLIPALQDFNPTNTFLAYIKPDFKKIDKSKREIFLPKYKFNFDIDTLSTVADQNKAYYIQKGFNELSNITLGDLFEVKEGKDIPVTELIYLYDRVTSLSGFGQDSLDRAFELYVATNKKENSVAKKLATIVQEHDRGIRPDIHLNPFMFTAFCYQNQIRLHQKGTAIFDAIFDKKSRKWDLSKAKSIDISKKFLFNLDNIHEYNDFLLQAEQFGSNLVKEQISAKIIIDGNTSYWEISTFEGEPLSRFIASSIDPTISGLVKDLYSFKNSYPEEWNEFNQNLKEFNDNLKVQRATLKSFQTTAVYKKFAERMKNLGIQVETYKADPSEHGKVENGIIFLNTNSDITTTPMHELMHMILAVMKEDDYGRFERLMKTAMNSNKIQEIYKTISQSSEYVNMMELDRQEEAFCRYLEGIITSDPRKQISRLDDIEEQDILDTVKELLNPYISKTLGINPIDNLLMFLSDTISALPSYNSTLFMKQSRDTTGYLEQKTKVIRSVNISAFIKSLITNKKLIETEC